MNPKKSAHANQTVCIMQPLNLFHIVYNYISLHIIVTVFCIHTSVQSNINESGLCTNVTHKMPVILFDFSFISIEYRFRWLHHINIHQHHPECNKFSILYVQPLTNLLTHFASVST